MNTAPLAAVSKRDRAMRTSENAEPVRKSVPSPLAPTTNPGTVNSAALRRLTALTAGLKGRIAELLTLAPGQRVLDVGCGLGQDAVSALRCVRPGGFVAGIDYDSLMIQQAQGPTRLNPFQPSYLVADAARIPFADRVFDRCYSERVLQHTPAAGVVVGEMVRVTKPGGVVVAADTDWATLSIDTPATTTERALVRFVGDALCNGYAGRQLRRLLKDYGLTRVHTEVWPIVWTSYATFRATSLFLLKMGQQAVRAGAVSAEDLAQFDNTLAKADRRGAFFASAAVVIAQGQKPSARHLTALHVQEDP